jgi:glycosyltransferase involved in cell wall biosynthesis
MLDERENVAALIDSVRSALGERTAWELILVDDGSRDGTADVAIDAAGDDPRIRVVRLGRRYGQATALQAGLDRARGETVVTLDADLQNDPRDIPRLVEMLESGYDLVAGYREIRHDRFLTRRLPSIAANKLIGWVTGLPIRDNGCTLKAYRRELLRGMRLYSDLHRFIPALAAGATGARVAELSVRHFPRIHGSSKYGLSRVPRVLLDLLTIKMLHSFRLRPLALFAILSAIPALVGSMFAFALLVTLMQPHSGTSTVILTGVALMCFALAVYVAMLGLIGEVALRKQKGLATAAFPLVREVK